MIPAFAQKLAARLRSTTQRERAALALCGAVLSLTAAVYAFDWATGQSQAARAAHQRRADLEAMLADLGDAAQQQRIANEASKVWRYALPSSPGAEEQIVATLEILTAQSGLTSIEVALDQSGEANGSVRQVLVRISADFDWAGLVALLSEFEASETSFVVTGIDVSQTEEAPRLSLLVAAQTIQQDEAS